jgi:hypothetical protein
MISRCEGDEIAPHSPCKLGDCQWAYSHRRSTSLICPSSVLRDPVSETPME